MNTRQLHLSRPSVPAIARPAAEVRLPDGVSTLRELEKRIAAATMRALRREPIRRKAEFSVSHGPRVAWLSAWPKVGVLALPVLAVVGCADMGLAGAPLWFVGGALAPLSAYLLAWCVGMRRLLRESGLGVSLQAIDIDLGLRGAGSVPMHAVRRCHAAPLPAALAPQDVWLMTPSEEPNVLLELAGPTTIDTVRFGAPLVRTVKYVALYADEPGVFAAAVHHAMPGRQRSFG
jgi:hypothetical protein